LNFFGSIEDEIATNRDPMTEAVRIPFQIFEKVKFSRKKPKKSFALQLYIICLSEKKGDLVNKYIVTPETFLKS
jgi:hypothetical protein